MYNAFDNILIEVTPKWYPYYVISGIEMKSVKCDVAVDTSYSNMRLDMCFLLFK